MPKYNSDELFLLIKSLSKAEKRYFKHYAAMGAGGKQIHYVKLFDMVEAQKKYREKSIIRRLAPVSASQFSNRKKYLTELILESLRWYHSHRSVDSQLCSAVMEIESLYEKRLLRQCLKHLYRAKEKALHYDKQRHLLELLAWEEKLLVETAASEKSETALGRVFTENKTAAEHVKNEIALRELLNVTNKLFRKGGLLRGNEQVAELRKVENHPLMKTDKNYSSYHELYYYYNIKGMCSMMMNDWKKSYVWRKKHLELIEHHPGQIAESPRLYIAALNNMILCCEYTGRGSELEHTFEKVKGLLSVPAYEKNNAILLRLLGCCSSVLHYYILAGEFKKGSELLMRIMQPFNNVLPEINKSSEISFYYTFAYTCFGAEDYRRALYWLNKILNDTHTSVRDDIRVSARLLNLIVHYELGNESMLEYNVRSTYRFLYSRSRLFRIETIVLNFIRKDMHKINSKTELIAAFARLKSAIEKLAEDPKEKRSLEYFDFVSWLESKISGKKFPEVVRGKSEN